MNMTFGPSTTNADLSEALADLLERLRDQLSDDDYQALDEAATRINEMPDEEG